MTKPELEPETKEYRLINESKMRTFLCYLNHLGIKEILNDFEAESAYPQFYKIFQYSYEKSFPIKMKAIKERNNKKPWVSDELLHCIEIRDQLNRAANKKRIERKVFTDYRNELTNKLREAKNSYYRNKFEAHTKNMKKTWETINSVIKFNTFRSKISLSDDAGKKYNESDIPNTFIDFFTNVAQKLSSKIPQSQTTAESFLNNRINNTFTVSPICPAEVDTVIEELKCNDYNVNSISTTVLDKSKHIITPIICHLINLFVQQGYFPNNLKLGCITPIFKNGDKEKVNNYRPVCSLSPLSKIIEKVINNRMIDFLEDYDIFSKTQFGFRKNMSTETALLHYIDNIQNALNENKFTISIFMDLSKAFDVIDHKILERKLEHYGFRGNFLEFLLSFIRDRKYFVHINGKNSKTESVNIGVPQGSTLGPLLFLIYINDMIHSSYIFFLSQFADDSTVTYSSTNLDQALTIVESEFKHILNWLSANKLIINLSKTHLMLFTNRNRPLSISISANGQTIQEVTETKFLGVIVDNKLNWNAHINYITKKISKSVSILKMVKYTFPSDILKSLYYTLIYPYYTYCNLVWGSAANVHLEPLINLQKKSVRIVSKSGYLDHTEPIFNNLKILHVKQIYNLNCAKFMYQCYNNKNYYYFKDKLATNGDFHNYGTRNRDLLRKPYGRLKQFKNSFIYNGIDLWNILPNYTKSAPTREIFKNRIKIIMYKNEI